ncbi:LPXTG cell wall anchor domain-containing protein [Collinsella sp. AF14-35]|nr:LPXTG cell wall anchor domain-containing protein [Collinsella sp. AF14-35]
MACLDFLYDHHVRLPSTASAGLAISLVTAAALVAAGLYARRKKGRR